MTDTEAWIEKSDLPITQSQLLQVIYHHDGEKLSMAELSKYSKVLQGRLFHNIKLLCDKNLINWQDKTLYFACDDKTFSVNVTDIPSSKPLVRKAITATDIAKHKLKVLNKTNFIGVELQIYNLSKLYDKIYLKYSGRKYRSLPPAPELARKSRNWAAFKKLLEMLELNGFSPEKFIDIQFQNIKNYKRVEFFWPFPNMLYGPRAIEIFTWNFYKNTETGTVNTIDMKEDSFLKEVLASSIKTIKALEKSWPEQPRIFLIISVVEMLSPVYLATNKEYLRYMRENDLELPEDVQKVIVRLAKDDDFKNMAVNLMKELENECK